MVIYLNIGTNLGDREANLGLAVALVSERLGRVLRRSAIFHSKPWGFASQNDFLNLAIAVEPAEALAPLEILDCTQAIERQMGSAIHRDSNGAYIDRLIDIDIMAIDTIPEFSHPRLTLPHPHIPDRDFFRIPLEEIMMGNAHDGKMP